MGSWSVSQGRSNVIVRTAYCENESWQSAVEEIVVLPIFKLATTSTRNGNDGGSGFSVAVKGCPPASGVPNVKPVSVVPVPCAVKVQVVIEPLISFPL